MKKISLNVLKNVLTQQEMKKVTGGCDGGGGYCSVKCTDKDDNVLSQWSVSSCPASNECKFGQWMSCAC